MVKEDLEFVLAETFDGDGAPGRDRRGHRVRDRSLRPRHRARLRRAVPCGSSRPRWPIRAGPVGDLEILTRDELAGLAAGATAGRTCAGRSCSPICSTSAARIADAVAVVCDGREVSYRRTRRAVEPAGAAADRRGAGPETLVALGLSRSVESVLAVWAVAKAGAAFVPVDPGYPAERIEHMLTDSGAALGVTVAAAAERPAGHGRLAGARRSRGLAAVVADMSAAPITDAERIRPLHRRSPRVPDLHLRVDRHPEGRRAHAPGPGEPRRRGARPPRASRRGARTLHFASPSFDASVFETGDGAVRGRDHGRRPPRRLRRHRAGRGCSSDAAASPTDSSPRPRWRRWTPTGSTRLADARRRRGTVPAGTGGALGARTARCSTRTAPPRPRSWRTSANRCVRASRSRSAGRSAACPSWCSTRACTRSRRGGRRAVHRGAGAGPRLPPAAGAHGRPLRRGPVRLARRPDLPHRRPGPWHGPTARSSTSGRSDFQVKVRGFRIEPAEIDAALAAQPGVGFAVTIARHRTGGRDAAVLVRARGRGRARRARRAATRRGGATCPRHMVPASVTVLDRVPLDPDGQARPRRAADSGVRVCRDRVPGTRGPVESAVVDGIRRRARGGADRRRRQLLRPRRQLAVGDQRR